MTSRTVPAGRAPHIIIESAGGDLSIVGWEGEELLIKADEECRFSQDGDRIVLSCPDDMALRVPRLASLVIQTVGGDLALRGVTGDLQIQAVGGDASIRETNNVSLGSVHSDLSLRGARGSVDIRSVGSDASLREIQGDVSLESVGDDLALRDVRGSLKARVGKDVVLSLAPRKGNHYAVEAGDDVMLVLPAETDADLALEGEAVIVNWPGMEEEGGQACTLQLGRGGAKIAIRAGGEVRLSSQERTQQSPDEFGNFAGMMMDWPDFGAQLGAQITRQVQAVTQRATRQAERAARKAEAKLRGARGRSGMGRWDWNFDPNSIIPPAPREPVSESERMAILKMLAEKKITAAQADELLAALEGD